MNPRRARSAPDNRRFRQLRNRIGELRTEIGRLRAERGRREFLGQLTSIVTTLFAGWWFQSQPLQEPQPSAIVESKIDGSDALGGRPLLLPDGSHLLLPDGSRLLLPGD